MARQEDARIRYRVCQHLRRIPAPRTSLLQTNPILAALVERSANRRISAGFIVEDATGTTDRSDVPISRLTTCQSYQRMAFSCSGSNKIATWTRAQRVPRRVPPPPSAATLVRRHSKMGANLAKRECAEKPRCPPPKSATDRSRNGANVERGTGSPPGGTARERHLEPALLWSAAALPKGSLRGLGDGRPSSGTIDHERAWRAGNELTTSRPHH